MSASEAQSIDQAHPGTFVQDRPNPITHASELTLIRGLIWAYFLLLLFEGALRKWFLVEHSTMLLIVRDPIVIWIYYLAFAQGLFPIDNTYLEKALKWTILATAVSLVIVGTHWKAVAYGIHTNLLHFPLIFINLKKSSTLHIS